MTPFSVLGLPDTATVEDAKKRYRKLAQYYHPDRNNAPEAESHFKKMKEAWERIEAGWQPADAPPEPIKEAWKRSPQKAFVIRATFKEVYQGALMQVPGTTFMVKPPYGVRPGTNLPMKVWTADGVHDIFHITWDVYDPNGFYYIRWVEIEEFTGFPGMRVRSKAVNKHVLACNVKVTAAQLLAGHTMTLPNINPQVGGFTITLTPEIPLLVSYAGLQKSLSVADGRDSLYIFPEVVYKALEDERYDVLLKLREQVDAAINGAAAHSALG